MAEVTVVALLAFAAGGTCPSDVNNDGTVGINDFLAVLAAWGPCPIIVPRSSPWTRPPPLRTSWFNNGPTVDWISCGRRALDKALEHGHSSSCRRRPMLGSRTTSPSTSSDLPVAKTALDPPAPIRATTTVTLRFELSGNTWTALLNGHSSDCARISKTTSA